MDCSKQKKKRIFTSQQNTFLCIRDNFEKVIHKLHGSCTPNSIFLKLTMNTVHVPTIQYAKFYGFLFCSNSTHLHCTCNIFVVLFFYVVCLAHLQCFLKFATLLCIYFFLFFCYKIYYVSFM